MSFYVISAHRHVGFSETLLLLFDYRSFRTNLNVCQYQQESNTIGCHSVAILTTNQVVNGIPNNLCISPEVYGAYILEGVHPFLVEYQVPS